MNICSLCRRELGATSIRIGNARFHEDCARTKTRPAEDRAPTAELADAVGVIDQATTKPPPPDSGLRLIQGNPDAKPDPKPYMSEKEFDEMVASDLRFLRECIEVSSRYRFSASTVAEAAELLEVVRSRSKD